MPNIIRFDPFSAVPPFGRTFDDVFSGLLRPMQALAPVNEELRSFRMDVSETDKDYIVHADLPGVKKEDIKVSIEGNLVTVDAEIRELPVHAGEPRQDDAQTPATSAKQLRRERHVGRVFRSFTLPMDVDAASARAQFGNGVLTLTLPKKQQAGKQLTIE